MDRNELIIVQTANDIQIYIISYLLLHVYKFAMQKHFLYIAENVPLSEIPIQHLPVMFF
jgi:hypothetical protein